MTNQSLTRGAGRASSLPMPVRIVLRLLAAVGWTALGLFAFAVCEGIFAGYPQFHTPLLTTVGTIAIALIGGITWIVDERRTHDDE